MEDVLEVYSRPYDEDYPVICMDEKPVQFFSDFRKGFRSKKNGVQYEDYQYIRNGTASIFLFTEPLAGWRYADAQERRTAQDWAKQIDWLLTKQYPTGPCQPDCVNISKTKSKIPSHAPKEVEFSTNKAPVRIWHCPFFNHIQRAKI